MDCVDATFKQQRKKSELDQALQQSDIHKWGKEFEHLSNGQKQQILISFLSQKSVLSSLYDMMFLDRINHRATTSFTLDSGIAVEYEDTSEFPYINNDKNLLRL